jgi:hypothetical protein
LFLPLPTCTCPPQDPHSSPFSLFFTPTCHCSLDKRPEGSSCMGPGALSKVGCRHAVPFVVLFSANTKREARINSQTDTKQRDRETAIQRPVTRKMVSGWEDVPDGRASKWMEPSVQSLSHAWVGCSVGWRSHATGLYGCCGISPSHCP